MHLCVWTKFPLDVDENDPNGDLTPEMRAKIDGFVDKTFRSRVPAENVRSSSSLSLSLFLSVLVNNAYIRIRLSFSSYVGFELTSILPKGHLVQKLGQAQIHTRHGAFPRHDEGSGHGVYKGNHKRR